MFNIEELQDTYSWKIMVKIAQNGRMEKIPVMVKYNRLPHDEKEELFANINEMQEADILERIFAGWEKGQIKDGKDDLEDTTENREKLLNITEFRIAVLNGFTESLGGDVGKRVA